MAIFKKITIKCLAEKLGTRLWFELFISIHLNSHFSTPTFAISLVNTFLFFRYVTSLSNISVTLQITNRPNLIYNNRFLVNFKMSQNLLFSMNMFTYTKKLVLCIQYKNKTSIHNMTKQKHTIIDIYIKPLRYDPTK